MKCGRGLHKAKEGKKNRERVREYIASHPGCIQKDVAEALGIGRMTVAKHSKAIKEEDKATEAR